MIEGVRFAVERNLHYLPPTAYCLLPTAYRLPPTAYCLPSTVYRLPVYARILATVSIDRRALSERFTRVRARTRALFALVSEEAYYARPIPLRNPVVFYEGHMPAFAVNTLLKRGLGEPGIDAELETIFARGIDPDEEAAAVARGNPAWPTREVVREYAGEADRRIADALANGDIVRDDRPLLVGGEAAWAILEHEEMHQETLAYIWHQMPYAWKRKPESYLTAPPRLCHSPPGEQT